MSPLIFITLMKEKKTMLKGAVINVSKSLFALTRD